VPTEVAAGRRDGQDEGQGEEAVEAVGQDAEEQVVAAAAEEIVEQSDLVTDPGRDERHRGDGRRGGVDHVGELLPGDAELVAEGPQGPADQEAVGVVIEEDHEARRPGGDEHRAPAAGPARDWRGAELARLSARADLLVDCTSAGLGDASYPAPVLVATLPDGAAVASLVYSASLPLLDTARGRGPPVMDGAAMLVHQGARAFTIWTGLPAPLHAMWAAMTS
jgi:hypothetical protein